jgi:methanol metabolism-related c-type cytochrome
LAVVTAIALGGVYWSAIAQDTKEPAKKEAPAPAAGAEVQPGLQKEVTLADGCLSQDGAELKDGKWVLPDGTPTFHVCKKDGQIVVDWATYNGYRRYHGECHVCHGPNGLGSTYAPALAEHLKWIPYGDFLGIVASGKQRDEAGTKFVMPAFGDNKNVMCFINDLYVYLKARSTGALPAGQLGGRNRTDKTEQAKQEEKDCLGS